MSTSPPVSLPRDAPAPPPRRRSLLVRALMVSFVGWGVVLALMVRRKALPPLVDKGLYLVIVAPMVILGLLALQNALEQFRLRRIVAPLVLVALAGLLALAAVFVVALGWSDWS